MTNKEKYVKSVDNLKADEYLKISVLKKTQEKPKKAYYFKFANVAIIMIFIISCALIMSGRENVVDNSIYKNHGIAKVNSKIKQVENEETLKSILNYNKEEIQENVNSFFEASSTSGIDAVQMEIRDQNLAYSKTNIQVEGVDEADIVKTDGNYIYYSGINDKVIIVDKNLNKVAEINLQETDRDYGGTQEIYLYSNKLITISQKPIYIMEDVISYNYNIINTSTTKIKVYNVEDKANIVKEREIELEGNYLSSRMIADNIYIITNQSINIEDPQPSYIDTVAGSEERKVSYLDMYYIENENIEQYLNIAGFSVNKNEEANIQTFLGVGNTIYANENNLYITNTKYNYENLYTTDSLVMPEVKTEIYKFKMINSKVEFKEFAEVEGRIINQFAMDETDGYFRIATTSNNIEDNITSNNLFVLDARLNNVGKLTNIAEGESIYSVRFMNKKVYMVTYEQVDPLFVIDLSKPSAPKVLGELKIPGFSNYLHPYDDTHLIGIGQETEVLENGNTKTIGLKVSLFDVSDVNSPKEISKLVIEGENVYTQAYYNHKAFLFIKEQGILAFPISMSTGPKTAFYGTEVVSISIEDGVQEKGRVETDAEGKDYKKSVDRVIYIEDSLYSIFKAGIVASNINTLEQINRVDF